MMIQSGQMPEIQSQEEKLLVLDSLSDWEITAKQLFSWLSIIGN